MPSKIPFPELFAVCTYPKINISDCFISEQWFQEFQKSFVDTELLKWKELMAMLGSEQLTNEQDKVVSG
uniref:Uncharacterized protein n=1 Tax=Arundo donax TaxID=35708 RepID=A0A0A9AZT4_ARUDO